MNASIEPLSTNKKYADIQDIFSFDEEVMFEKDDYHYTFHLSQADLKARPLIKINDDLFIQVYMDTFRERLVAIRVVTADILLSLLPYSLTFEGTLPHSDDKKWSAQEWKDIQSGMEQQIFDMTNVFRKYFEKSALNWDKSLHSVALSHSKDMKERDYFSHVAPNGDGLSERLTEWDISYQSAGENIAADYDDAPDVVAGWLNSEGHRQIMLDDSFTSLGVGVYRNYYTQNYLKQGH